MRGETSETAVGTDTPAEIMDATYRALCEHGFADLTMQDIADESDKSTAALHYHYDTKEALLLAFLDHLYEAFTEKYGRVEGENAVERLVAFVDSVLRREDPEAAQQFQTALLEIRAQAPYVGPFREELTEFDAFVRDRVREIVADGIEEGTVRSDADPEAVAQFVATLVDGVNVRRVTVGDTGDGTRRTFLAFVREHLVAPDADVTVDPRSDDPCSTGSAAGASTDPAGPDDTSPEGAD